MSIRYYFSPALRLKIGKSKLLLALHGALCLVLLCAVYLVYARGYTLLVVPVATIGLALLCMLRFNPSEGSELCWRQGVWTLERNDIIREISLSRGSMALPWLVYIRFIDLTAGFTGHIWLYADCASTHQLRLLRVRLTLLR